MTNHGHSIFAHSFVHQVALSKGSKLVLVILKIEFDHNFMNKLIEWVKSLLGQKPTATEEPMPSATEASAEVTEPKANTSPATTPEATPPAEIKEEEVSEPEGNAVQELQQEVSEPSTQPPSSSAATPLITPPPEEK